METEPTDQASTHGPHDDTCICRAIAAHIMTAFGLSSETARQHVQNARLEMLKAARAVIDERINQLSRTEPKGTKVVVE